MKAGIVCVGDEEPVPLFTLDKSTDTAGHSGRDIFEENCAKASIITADIAAALLTEIGRAW